MNYRLTRIIRQIVLPNNERDVLLVMAEHVQHDSIVCCTDAPLLAWELGTSPEHIRRMQKRLRDRGVLVAVGDFKGGAGRPVQYELHPEAGELKPLDETQPYARRIKRFRQPEPAEPQANSTATEGEAETNKKGDHYQSPFSAENPEHQRSPFSGSHTQRSVIAGTKKGDQRNQKGGPSSVTQSNLKDVRDDSSDSNRPDIVKSLGNVRHLGRPPHSPGANGHNGSRASPEAPPPPYSAYLAALASDYSTEFGDGSHVTSNATQALRIWERSGLSEQEFGELMHEARKVVRGAQSRRPSNGAIQNKMAYYFAVLRDMLNKAPSAT